MPPPNEASAGGNTRRREWLFTIDRFTLLKIPNDSHVLRLRLSSLIALSALLPRP